MAAMWPGPDGWQDRLWNGGSALASIQVFPEPVLQILGMHDQLPGSDSESLTEPRERRNAEYRENRGGNSMNQADRHSVSDSVTQ